jgi:hypothetical protein
MSIGVTKDYKLKVKNLILGHFLKKITVKEKTKKNVLDFGLR